MSEQQQLPPVYHEETGTEDQKERTKRLREVFADLEKKQPDVLDEAAKSIIERIATFLAILFGVIALGGNFPPRYLVSSPWAKGLVIGVLLCYLFAMGIAMGTLQPRNYSEYLYNITRLEKEWERLIKRKKRWTQWAGILFGVGTVALAGLIVAIIWPL